MGSRSVGYLILLIVVKISDVRRHLEFYQYLEEEEEFYRLEAERAAREQEQYLAQLQPNGAEIDSQAQQGDELKQAADEAAKAAQEAAKAAAEASQGLLKGISSFGGNLMEQSGVFGFGGSGKEKKATAGFSLGGFGLGSLGATPQAQKKPQTVSQPKAQPPKPELPAPAVDAYLKPLTGRMTARERWWWAYRMTVQVKLHRCLHSGSLASVKFSKLFYLTTFLILKQNLPCK